MAVPCGMNLDSFVSFFSTTVLKHIVDNGWWGYGHKNTRHSMWVFFLLTIYIVGGAWCSHFKVAVRRWQRRWCVTDRSAMSSPYWPSAANSNAIKDWAEVKTSQTPPSAFPQSQIQSFCRSVILFSQCLCKYPINY